MTTEMTVWKGAEQLRQFLVPVGDLIPWEQNPRQGDVMALVMSLRRFGQVRAVATRADGKNVIAGHHLRLAAIEEGWTHIAAIPMEFESEAEADIYGLADNELGMLGGYDEQKLYEVMEQHQLFDTANLEGTGFTMDRSEDIRAAAGMVPSVEAGGEMERGFSEDAQAAQERASQLAASNAMKETVLMLSLAEREKYDTNVKLLAKHWEMTSVIQVVLRALDEMAQIASSIEQHADEIQAAADESQDDVIAEPMEDFADEHVCEVLINPVGRSLPEGMNVLVKCSCGMERVAIHGEAGEKLKEEHLATASVPFA